MNDESISLVLPKSIRTAAARLAQEDGVSLDYWIALAVAQKVGAVESAAEFFRRRSEGASGNDLRRALDRVSALTPEPGDELSDQDPAP